MKSPGVLLALYCLLLTSLLAVQLTTAEEATRTSRFEPERKSRFRNGGRTRTPKHKSSTQTYGETQRPRFGQLYPSYNPFNAKPSQPLIGSGNGLIETGGGGVGGIGDGLAGGVGGLQSTQLPPQSTTPRNSEFLKGRSKEIMFELRKFRCPNIVFTFCRVYFIFPPWVCDAVCTNRGVGKWELN